MNLKLIIVSYTIIMNFMLIRHKFVTSPVHFPKLHPKSKLFRTFHSTKITPSPTLSSRSALPCLCRYGEDPVHADDHFWSGAHGSIRLGNCQEKCRNVWSLSQTHSFAFDELYHIASVTCKLYARNFWHHGSIFIKYNPLFLPSIRRPSHRGSESGHQILTPVGYIYQN
jgi:hypothetical protein